MSTELPSTAPRRGRALVLVGIVGSTLVALGLGLIVAVANRPFQSYDENQHVAYALDVSRGRLPTLSTVIRPEIPGMHPDAVYTANHPPLFYALEALPLRIGVQGGAPLGGLLAARAINVLVAAVGVVALALMARAVLPRRPLVRVLAPALIAPLPLSLATAGQVYNDALSDTTVVLALFAAVVLILRGPSRGRLGLLAVAALAAAATRATGLEVAGLATVAAVLAPLLHRPDGRPRTVAALRGAAAGLFVAATVTVGIGWFYLRNDRLYGDPTGARVVLRLFHFPVIPLDRSLPSGDFWYALYRGLFGRPRSLTGWIAVAVDVIGVLLLFAITLGVGRLVRAGMRRRLSGAQVAVAAVLLAHVVITLASLLVYVSEGGAAYSRYLLSAAPVLALVAAAGLDLLPRPVAAFVGIGVSGTVATIALLLAAREPGYRDAAVARLAPATLLSRALRLNGVGSPTVTLGVLLAAGILGLVCLLVAGAGLSRRVPAPAGTG